MLRQRPELMGRCDQLRGGLGANTGQSIRQTKDEIDVVKLVGHANVCAASHQVLIITFAVSKYAAWRSWRVSNLKQPCRGLWLNHRSLKTHQSCRTVLLGFYQNFNNDTIEFCFQRPIEQYNRNHLAGRQQRTKGRSISCHCMSSMESSHLYSGIWNGSTKKSRKELIQACQRPFEISCVLLLRESNLQTSTRTPKSP